MVTEEALPPPPLLLELLSSPPHAATPNANAATRQPEAAIERVNKEPLLRSRLVGGDFTHAFIKWGRSVSDGAAEAFRTGGPGPGCPGAAPRRSGRRRP